MGNICGNIESNLEGNIWSNCVKKCTCHQPQILVCSNNFDLIQLRARK